MSNKKFKDLDQLAAQIEEDFYLYDYGILKISVGFYSNNIGKFLYRETLSNVPFKRLDQISYLISDASKSILEKKNGVIKQSDSLVLIIEIRNIDSQTTYEKKINSEFDLKDLLEPIGNFKLPLKEHMIKKTRCSNHH